MPSIEALLESARRALRFKPREAPRVIKSPEPSARKPEGAHPTSRAKPEKKPEPVVRHDAPKASPESKAPTADAKEIRSAIAESVRAKAKDQPVGRRLEVVLDEAKAYGEVSPQIQEEVHRLAKIVNEPPSAEGWESIQRSIRTLSSYSDPDVIEVARAVRAEVHQYTFFQVVSHAQEYGLTATDAPEVASTLRHATVARFRAEQTPATGQIAPPEVRQAMEKALLDAEVDREWQTASEIASEARQRSNTDETGKKAKEMREAEDVSVEDAKARIRELIKSCPKEDREWMEQLLNQIKTNKDAADGLMKVRPTQY